MPPRRADIMGVQKRRARVAVFNTTRHKFSDIALLGRFANRAYDPSKFSIPRDECSAQTKTVVEALSL